MQGWWDCNGRADARSRSYRPPHIRFNRPRRQAALDERATRPAEPDAVTDRLSPRDLRCPAAFGADVVLIAEIAAATCRGYHARKRTHSRCVDVPVQRGAGCRGLAPFQVSSDLCRPKRSALTMLAPAAKQHAAVSWCVGSTFADATDPEWRVRTANHSQQLPAKPKPITSDTGAADYCAAD